MDSTEITRSGLDGHIYSPAAHDVPSASLKASRSARLIGGVTGWHAPVLLLILFAIFPLVVVDSVWSADIGARLYQAKNLLATGDWAAVHPLPRADPEGLFFPLHLSAATDADFRYIPYPKHPLLVWITAAEYKLGLRLPGDPATNIVSMVVGLHTLSTFATAIGTSRLVARTRPRLAVPALWFTGLISPLFVDAYVGHAHSLAAALFVWATVLMLQFLEPPADTAPDGSRLAAAALLIAVACLVRTESFFLGAAISGGLLVAGRHRPTAHRWVIASVAVGLTTLAATVVDRLTLPASTGPANPLHGGEPWGGLAGRVQGMQRTLLSPGGSNADVLILAVAVLVLLAGFLIGRNERNGESNKVPELCLVAAVVAAGIRVFQGDMVLIFGLFLACPLLLVGLLRVGRATLANGENRFHLTTVVLFAAAVIATQYRYGGGAEWGGRYFAIGVPFAVVLAVQGLATALKPVSASRARRLVVLAVIPAVVLNLAGLYGIRESRMRTSAMVDAVAEVTATVRLRTEGAADDSVVPGAAAGERVRPIVITTVPAAGRLSWAEIDNGRWLLVDKGELATVARRLADLDVRHWILLSTDTEEELAEIQDVYLPEPWEPDDRVPADIVVVSNIDD